MLRKLQSIANIVVSIPLIKSDGTQAVGLVLTTLSTKIIKPDGTALTGYTEATFTEPNADGIYVCIFPAAAAVKAFTLEDQANPYTLTLDSSTALVEPTSREIEIVSVYPWEVAQQSTLNAVAGSTGQIQTDVATVNAIVTPVGDYVTKLKPTFTDMGTAIQAAVGVTPIRGFASIPSILDYTLGLYVLTETTLFAFNMDGTLKSTTDLTVIINAQAMGLGVSYSETYPSIGYVAILSVNVATNMVALTVKSGTWQSSVFTNGTPVLLPNMGFVQTLIVAPERNEVYVVGYNSIYVFTLSTAMYKQEITFSGTTSRDARHLAYDGNYLYGIFYDTATSSNCRKLVKIDLNTKVAVLIKDISDTMLFCSGIYYFRGLLFTTADGRGINIINPDTLMLEASYLKHGFDVIGAARDVRNTVYFLLCDNISKVVLRGIDSHGSLIGEYDVIGFNVLATTGSCEYSDLIISIEPNINGKITPYMFSLMLDPTDKVLTKIDMPFVALNNSPALEEISGKIKLSGPLTIF